MYIGILFNIQKYDSDNTDTPVRDREQVFAALIIQPVRIITCLQININYFNFGPR